MIGNSVTRVNTVYKILLSVYNNNQKQRHKEKIMEIALLNSLHDYYEGYLKAAMKGSNSYSFLLKNNSRDELNYHRGIFLQRSPYHDCCGFLFKTLI